jgi:hypothetical protein
MSEYDSTLDTQAHVSRVAMVLGEIVFNLAFRNERGTNERPT